MPSTQTATVVKLPKSLIEEGEFVIISRYEYEAFIGHRKAARPGKWAKRNADLATALAQVKRGETVGPFRNTRDLMRSLRTE